MEEIPTKNERQKQDIFHKLLFCYKIFTILIVKSLDKLAEMVYNMYIDYCDLRRYPFMKKYLALAMVALLLVCSLASCTSGSDGSIGDYAPEVNYLSTESGTFYFKEAEGDTAILTKYVGIATSDDHVKIPSTFNDRVVTGIGDGAFYNLAAIVEVEIPDSIVTIGANAFARCTELTHITIPGSVLEIGESAFLECTAMTKVEFSFGLETIGEKAFYGCSALTDINLPTSLQSIEKGAFAFCKALPELKVPASVVSIGELAFTDCVGIESITFANASTNIGFGAFEHEDGTNLKDKFVTNALAADSKVMTYVNSLSDSPETEPVTEEVSDEE